MSFYDDIQMQVTKTVQKYPRFAWTQAQIVNTTGWSCHRWLDPGAVEFSRLTESNFRGVEVVDWPVKPPSNFFRAAAAFNVQFFDAIEFLVFNSFKASFNIKKTR